MLEPVIDHINTQLETLNLFQQFFGLCELIKVEKPEADPAISESYPAEYCTNDEYKQVLDSDFKKGVVYHRKTGNLSITEDNDQVISGCDVYQEYTYPMRLVVVVTKDILTKKNNDQWLADKIVLNITNAITTENDSVLNALLSSDVVSIEVTGSDTDRYSVWDDETDGLEMKVNFNTLMIAIDYEVTIAGSQDCFVNYGCLTFAPVLHYLYDDNLLDETDNNNDLTAFLPVGTNQAIFVVPPTSAFNNTRGFPSQRNAYDRRENAVDTINGITNGNLDRAIALWVKWEAPTVLNAQTLVYFGSGLDNNLSIFKAINSPTVSIGGATTNRDTTHVLNQTEWEHYIFQYHASRDVEFYVNNVLIDSATLAGDLNYITGDLFVSSNIAAPNNANPDTAFRFSGEVGDVRFYEGDLGAPERAAIFNAGQGTALTELTV